MTSIHTHTTLDGAALTALSADDATSVYPDGLRVLCVATAEVSDGLIVRQLSAQAWD